MIVAVLDGRDGSIGARIVKRLAGRLPDGWQILALGTNAAATSAMLEAGADQGASGEGAVVWNSLRAAAVAGPLGIVLANSLLGEVTPRMAEAVASAPARKFLLPVADEVEIAGVGDAEIQELVDDLVKRLLAWAASPAEDEL